MKKGWIVGHVTLELCEKVMYVGNDLSKKKSKKAIYKQLNLFTHIQGRCVCVCLLLKGGGGGGARQIAQ